MKTIFSSQIKPEQRTWYITDASGKVLGRLATDIATALRGRRKPDWSNHMDNGDFVVVTNCAKIAVTGNKLEGKEYISHSKYPGSLKRVPLKTMLAKDPCDVVYRAVEGMVSRTKLKPMIMRRLKLFAGAEHPHADKNPVAL
jgi:large subunit ribosomal protein L13